MATCQLDDIVAYPFHRDLQTSLGRKPALASHFRPKCSRSVHWSFFDSLQYSLQPRGGSPKWAGATVSLMPFLRVSKQSPTTNGFHFDVFQYNYYPSRKLATCTTTARDARFDEALSHAKCLFVGRGQDACRHWLPPDQCIHLPVHPSGESERRDRCVRSLSSHSCSPISWQDLADAVGQGTSSSKQYTMPLLWFALIFLHVLVYSVAKAQGLRESRW